MTENCTTTTLSTTNPIGLACNRTQELIVRSRRLTARSAVCSCYGYQIAKGKLGWVYGMHGTDDKFQHNFGQKTGIEMATWKTKIRRNNIKRWAISAEVLPGLFFGDIKLVTL